MLGLLLLWHGRKIPTAPQGMSSQLYWYAGLVAVLARKENIHCIPRSVHKWDHKKIGRPLPCIAEHLAIKNRQHANQHKSADDGAKN